ncbi:cell division protein ZapA [Litorilituus lipolyticus]|uniref:Cell division protein ZapA n=1 Tax=Litorilituus lipolyticus TaxID=2491017 RepID=A0A502L537_9GAMM|nr:cell division protein ZapA [Litorilituus lipolyticus]TPH18069.1 cell division protein ZapA [Litorilituus lipolyticus]
MSQRTVEINVLDRKLKVACPSGQETALLSAAEELSKRLSHSNNAKAITTPEQSLLMTALNLANDLLQAQQQLKVEQQENQEKIALLQATIEQALSPSNNKRA